MDATRTKSWAELRAHHDEIAGRHLRELFDEGGPARVDAMTVSAADLVVDLSKHRATPRTLELLADLADEISLRDRFAAMFGGEKVNVTEHRSVLHTALRLPRTSHLEVDGVDVVAQVHEVLDRMSAAAERIRSGAWKGATGQRIRTVVNIGIGGSDLGPVMAYEALRPYATDALTCRFVSNVDPADIAEKTHDLDPATTLFVVVSKTFTTQETLANARAAREWLLSGLGAGPEAVPAHFVAVSTNADKVSAFGIDTANMFGFWDWVGGRYSFPSAVGFSLMVAIGPDNFRDMLAGFHEMDEHAWTAPWTSNAPVLLGLLSVWYRDLFGAQSKAVLPYSQYLHRFPAYLQQLTMESNGKSVRLDGSPVTMDTAAVWWGEPGTNGQHAFYQMLHQGTTLVPADFLAFAEPAHDVADMHDLFMSNVLAQSGALAFGRTAAEVAADGTPPELVPHKVMPGNRPSTTIMAERLTPKVLGELVALYEHAVFTEAAVWDINAFDQWGVELGKVMANRLAPLLVSKEPPELDGIDPSTAALVRLYRAWRGRTI